MTTIEQHNPGSGDARPAPGARPRSVLRSVAVPTEHGGWGLTLEPGLLGLFVASSAAGACLAAAALVGFVARTPVKVVLVDLARHRRLERTSVAARVAAVELTVLAVLVVAAAVLAEGAFWWPALVAAPLVGVELWFDMRSRSRRLVPELAGAIGVSAVVAMIVLADGGPTALAFGLWLVLGARVLTSVPFVRAQVAMLHDRSTDARELIVADLSAVAAAALAVVVDPQLTAGALAIAGVIVFQRVSARRPVPRAAVLGARQTVLGATVVVVTALGVLAP